MGGTAVLVGSGKRKHQSAPNSEMECLGRDLGTAALVFHQTIADRLGLNPTDHKCLELLQRAQHPTARRKVLIRVIPDRFEELRQLFSGLATGMGELCRSFSAAELQVIKDYMSRSADLFRRETLRLRMDETTKRG